MRRRLVTLLLTFCGLGLPAAAQAQYRFDTWTTDTGLPQNGVRQIAQTPDGYLWFTTFDGLVRFDGVRFTTFSTSNTPGIINNRFTGLYRDSDGTLYATTMEDGVLTIYRHGTFTSYRSDQVPGHYIQRIVPDARGELRFLVEDESRTSKSYYYLRDGRFVFSEREETSDEHTYVGPSGAVWRISPTRVVEERRGVTTVYRPGIGPLPFRPNAFEDSRGHLWLGEYSVYQLGNGAVRRFGPAEGLPSSIHHSFWENADGSVWFASGGGSTRGVGLVRHHEGRLHAFGSESGLLNTSIFSVFHDREGTTWVATNKGLSRLRKAVLSGYSVKDGLNHAEVYPVYRDRRDRIWIGTTQGLSIFAQGRFSPLAVTAADPSAPADERWDTPRMSVQSLWEDPTGRMWVGLNGGIHIVTHGRARMLRSAKGHHVFAIRGDREGSVWVATNKGLLRYRHDALVQRLGVPEGLPNEFMTTIFEDASGTLWFGGLGGLTRYRNGTLTNFTTAQGLGGNYVRAIYEDADGTLWIGTYDEGLSRFKNGRFVSYKADDGLYNNGVFAIEEDARGHFWISSNRGIYRVTRDDLDAFADGRISRINSVGYGTQDGMLSTECNGGRQPASLADAEGRFWFPTQDGVVVIDPRNEAVNLQAPSVVIESATVERAPVDLRDGLTIEPGLKNIEINFAGVSLIRSEQMKFRYKLEGHDAEWVEAGPRRTAYYSYLPPGAYRFRVVAANSDNLWNETGAALALELKPFFYETRLFRMLSALGAALLLLVIWKVSVHQLESRERTLARLVYEKTEALRQANDELQLLANSDGLTGVANRRRFEGFLADEWRRAIRFRTEISLVLIDIDHFKRFNDTYGHLAGDQCLQQVATALRNSTRRPTDLLARIGGEEFAMVLGGTDLAGARTIADAAMARVDALAIPHRDSPTSHQLTVSIGVATTTATVGMSEADFMRTADEALYRAKAEGRRRIVS
jgi:diguanylate cyclase (GGDEF)-like protein